MAKIAAIQMISAIDVDVNIASARRLITQAAEAGADLVLLPEYWPSLEARDIDKLEHAEEAGNGKMQSFMSEISKEPGIGLIGGTIPPKSGSPKRCPLRQDSLVQFPQGRRSL